MMLPVLSGIAGAAHSSGVDYRNVYEDARLEEEVVSMSQLIDGTGAMQWQRIFIGAI